MCVEGLNFGREGFVESEGKVPIWAFIESGNWVKCLKGNFWNLKGTTLVCSILCT